MDPDTDILFDYPNLFRIYKSGRIERLAGTEVLPAGLDPATGVTSKDVTIDAAANKITVRLFLPNLDNYSPTKKLPILMYFHGGAFCTYTPFSTRYHRYLNSLVSRAKLLAVSVDYRLAIEHLLPAAYDDSWAVQKWVLESNSDEWLAEHGDYKRVFLAGDSAGGNIAHLMAMRAGEKGMKLEGMALVHPFFWGKKPVRSESTKLKDRKFIEDLWSVVNLPGVDIDDPTINPIATGAPSLERLGCPRAMVAVAGNDLLAPRGKAYCDALKGSGWKGEVELLESVGEGHVFHFSKPECENAIELMERLVAFFNCEK